MLLQVNFVSPQEPYIRLPSYIQITEHSIFNIDLFLKNVI